MFLQHHSSATPTLSSSVHKQSNDFELCIQSSTAEKIIGQIRFTYLHQSFEASVILTPFSIQVKSLYPFAGIAVSANTLDTLAAQSFVHKGALTAQGHQQMIWLMLDIIHLYNLLRLKPGAIILIDNVLWSGKVLREAHPNDKETRVLQELNQLVTNDERVENVLLPIRDGLMALRVRG
jgi:hypothetical protein